MLRSMSTCRHGSVPSGVVVRSVRSVPRQCARSCVVVNASADGTSPSTAESALELLRRVAADTSAAPAKEVLKAIVAVEKAKFKPDGWNEVISAPGSRWRLIYTAGSKDSAAASKGQPSGSGQFVPLTAVQKYDGEEGSFENGIFLGPVAHLTFKGPYIFQGRQLTFGVTTMYIGIGPWRLPIKLGGKESLQDTPKAELGKMPFFIFSWADEDVVVARGRSGGLALWSNVGADAEWQAQAGVLQVYK